MILNSDDRLHVLAWRDCRDAPKPVPGEGPGRGAKIYLFTRIWDDSLNIKGNQ